MEIIPRAFPAWLTPGNSDQASCRALWLGLMGAVQIALGAGYIVRTRMVPAMLRMISADHSGEHATLALPSARAVAGR